MEEKIPVKSKFWLNIADCFSTTMNSLITGGGLTYLFVTYRGLDARLSGLVWLLFGIWNAFNDPLFGYISDRTKSRLGRRIPYIRYGSFFYGLIFAVSWLELPFFSGQIGMCIQMLVSLFLFDMLYTAIATSIYVMPYEMTVSNEARSSLFLWRLVFSVFSMAIPVVLLPLVRPEVGESAVPFRILMACIGLAAALVIFASSFFYKEQTFHRAEQPPFLQSALHCFRNRPFLNFLVVSFSVVFIQTILMTGVIYYFDAFSGCSMTACYGAMACGILLGILFWIRMQKTRGVRNSMLLMCVLFAAGTLIMIFFGGSPIPAAAGFFLIGTGFSGSMYLIPLMNGDVIDFDETVTGLRSEGMYAGINSLVTKPAISFANAAFPLILSWFGYDQTIPVAAQSTLARQGILIAWMAIPAILLILDCITLRFYALSGPEWDAKKQALARKHQSDGKSC